MAAQSESLVDSYVNEKLINMLNNEDKLLVVTSASTGNNIFCTPALRLLRKHLPNAQIDVVALNALTAQVFSNNTDIGQCLVVKGARKLDTVAKAYTHVLVLNRNALKKFKGLSTAYQLVPAQDPEVHVAEHILRFVAKLLKVELHDEDRHYVLNTDTSVEQVLAEKPIQADEAVINIHLGCGTTLLHGWKFFYSRRAADKKLWSIEAYIELGKLLQEKIPALTIVVTGTKNERFLAKQFKKSVPNTIDLTGKTTVSDLVAVMHRANCFIAHDCGVFHVAAATEVPIVALYGPTNPVLTGPYPIKAQHRLIKKSSMDEIQPAMVVDEVVALLQQYPRANNASTE